MNPLSPSSSFVEKQKEEEDPNLKLYIFSSTSQVLASSSSKLAFTTCFSTISSATHQHDHQTVNLHLHNLLQQSHHQLHHQGEKSIGGSREESEVIFSSSIRKEEGSERSRLLEKQVEDDNDDHQMIKKQDHNNGSAKYWMSSKMRLMQKMMINTNNNNKKVINGGANSDHQKATRNNEGDHGGKWETMTGKTSSSSSSCNSNIGVQNNGVRVCSDCNTTTTPLWRSGPQGPKSLCNACGIRQRKARRAMAEAANGSGGLVVESESGSGKKEMHKEKKSRLSCEGDNNGGNVVVGDVKNSNDAHNSKSNNSTLKAQSDQIGMMNNEVSFDGTHNFTLRLSKTSGPSASFERSVFPRDEEEAAILLMELSCGLLHTC